MASILREAGINTEIFPDSNTKLDRQLKYADKKGIPYAVIIGPEEAASNSVTLKDLTNQTQRVIKADDIISALNGQ